MATEGEFAAQPCYPLASFLQLVGLLPSCFCSLQHQTQMGNHSLTLVDVVNRLYLYLVCQHELSDEAMRRSGGMACQTPPAPPWGSRPPQAAALGSVDRLLRCMLINGIKHSAELRKKGLLVQAWGSLALNALHQIIQSKELPCADIMLCHIALIWDRPGAL